MDSLGYGKPVIPEAREIVAGVAGDGAVLGEPRVVVEHPPQVDLLVRQRIVRIGGLLRDRLEHPEHGPIDLDLGEGDARDGSEKDGKERFLHEL